jgi:hypothetical protein
VLVSATFTTNFSKKPSLKVTEKKLSCNLFLRIIFRPPTIKARALFEALLSLSVRSIFEAIRGAVH